MPNIYLRLPTAVACFHRNCDPDNPLSPFDPWIVPKYSDHIIPIKSGLQSEVISERKSPPSYSQKQWDNMLNGRRPNGGDIVLHRNSEQWLTYAEICKLEGRRLSKLSESYDFLCIKLPYTIAISMPNGDRKEIYTNSTFNLSPKPAETLQCLFMNDFQRAFIDWEIGTFHHCTQNPDGLILRGRSDTLERFLMTYDIPVSKDLTEKQSLRRQLDRWLKKARFIEKSYRHENISYNDSSDRIIKQ